MAEDDEWAKLMMACDSDAEEAQPKAAEEPQPEASAAQACDEDEEDAADAVDAALADPGEYDEEDDGALPPEAAEAARQAALGGAIDLEDDAPAPSPSSDAMEESENAAFEFEDGDAAEAEEAKARSVHPQGKANGKGKVRIAKAPPPGGRIAKAPPPGQARIAKAPPNGQAGGKGKGVAVVKGAGKGAAGKAAVKGAPQQPSRAPSGAPPAKNAGGKGKAGGRGKGKDDGGVAAKILQINAARLWPAGSGINTQALSALRGLPAEKALELLEECESQAASIPNPSTFLIEGAEYAALESSSEPKPSPKGGGKSKSQPGLVGMAAVAARMKQANSKGGRQAASAQDGKEAEEELQLAKRPHPEAQLGEQAGDASASSSAPGDVVVKAPVVAKIEACLRKGHVLDFSAVKALAAVASRDAAVVLQALLMRPGTVDNPSAFVHATLRKQAARDSNGGAKQSDAGASAPQRAQPLVVAGPAKRPAPGDAAGVPPAKRPVAAAGAVAGKRPTVAIGKSPGKGAGKGAAPQKGAAAKPAAGGGLRADPKDIGKPPQPRTDLFDFEQMAVQGKLQALNKQSIWSGPHPLDQAAFSVLLKIDPSRALEILDEVEEKGSSIKNPSEFVRNIVLEESR